MRKNKITLLYSTILIILCFSCQNLASSPSTFTLKKGAGYTYKDVTIGNTRIKVGIEASKGGSNLSTLDITHTNINGITTTQTNNVPGNERKRFSYDYEIYPPSPYATGTETWSFKITDEDGNSMTRTIKVTYI